MAKRVGLSGKPLAGKSTLAQFMAETYGYRHARMSDPIVFEYVRRLRESGIEVEVSEVYANKEAHRQGLQMVGDDMGFQDPNHILSLMQQALQMCGAWDHPEDLVVVEALRGELQASAARAFGFVVADLWVDEEVQRAHAGSDEAYKMVRKSMKLRPDIESGVQSAAIRLTPELSLENAAKLLYLLPERGLSHGPNSQPFYPGSLADWASIR